METSFRFSCSGFAVTGKSTSTFGGAKYMCTDIMHIIIPKKSCNNKAIQDHQNSLNMENESGILLISRNISMYRGEYTETFLETKRRII